MFDIVSIAIENCRSFKGVHRFKFLDEPGLYNLTLSPSNGIRFWNSAMTGSM
jgi:hypothetical protein